MRHRVETKQMQVFAPLAAATRTGYRVAVNFDYRLMVVRCERSHVYAVAAFDCSGQDEYLGRYLLP
jgi:hypothetical protein